MTLVLLPSSDEDEEKCETFASSKQLKTEKHEEET
jgi:hypothetical protein